MRRRLPQLLAGLGFAVGFGAAAQPPQPEFNYLEAQYVNLTPDADEAPELTGYRVEVSAPLDAGTFLRAAYERIRPDSGDRVTRLIGGLGARTPWRPGLDLYAIIEYEQRDSGPVDEDGFGGEAGLRWQLNDAWEIGGGGRYLDLEDSGHAQSWFGLLTLTLAPGIQFSGRYENGDRDRRWLAGLRFVNR